MSRYNKTYLIYIFAILAIVQSVILLYWYHETKQHLRQRIVLGGNDAFDQYLRRGYDINERFGDRTLLDEAVQNSNLYMVEKLLEKGANVNSVDSRSGTTLMRAALYADSAIVDLLLQHGADVAKRNADGANAVFFAVAGNPENIYLLVRSGADINDVKTDGNTPLLKAVQHYEDTKRGYVAVLTLLSLGANVNCTNLGGMTPIGLATKHGDTNLIHLFNTR